MMNPQAGLQGCGPVAISAPHLLCSRNRRVGRRGEVYPVFLDRRITQVRQLRGYKCRNLYYMSLLFGVWGRFNPIW